MKINGLRWFMIGLVFLATVINYIDRQTVSVLKTAISQDLGLSNADYAAVQNSFLVFYGISQLVSGRLYDIIGTRLGFVFSIVVWSFAAMAHAAARSAASFGLFRAVLGFGEAGNWPGAAKVVGEWFPVRERALGMGIFNTGAAVGGALSPPIIAWLATAYGWRMTFVVTGLLGFAWLALWLIFFRTPSQHPWITDAERSHILDGAAPATAGEAVWRPGWGKLLRYRQTWAIVMGRFITDPIWWLYIFWLPAYLQEARGFSLQQVGFSAWLPYLAGGLGALGGGYASGALISRGWSVDRARKSVMIFGAMLTPAGILAMRASDPYVALGWMAVVLFGFQVWVNNLQTLPSDFFPSSAVGSVFGLGGLAAAIASVVFNWGTGQIVDAFGYTPVFLIAGVLGPLGLIVTLWLAGRIGSISIDPKEITP
ncbi:MAG: MFS transporter [Vicinamibacteria bacterium]|nr:MFS transporter [Vicinamibacteria bacterium]